MTCSMAKEIEDQKKKRQRLGSHDLDVDPQSPISPVEPSSKMSKSEDEALIVLEESSFTPRAERVLRPRSRFSKTGSAGLREVLDVDSPQNVSSEKNEKFESDKSPEHGSRAADTLLSLHHVKESTKATAMEGNVVIDPKNLPQSASLPDDELKAEEQLSGMDPQQLEALEHLKDYIQKMNGVLGEGWEAEISRKNGRADKFYISPAKQKFRSRVEVARHLGLFSNSTTSVVDFQFASNREARARRPLPAYGKSERQKTPHLVRNRRRSHEGSQIPKLRAAGEDSNIQTKKDTLLVQAHSKVKNFEPSDPLKSCSMDATKPAEKLQREKQNPPSSKLITQRCQDILRSIISTEKFGGLTSLLNHGPPLGSFEASLPFNTASSISGSLDLQLIALRLATGAYGQTPEMFSEDLQQVWKNIDSVGHELAALAQTLSELSDKLYKELVLSLFPGESEERVGPVSSYEGQSTESHQAVESSSQELKFPHSKKVTGRSKFTQRSFGQGKLFGLLNSSQSAKTAVAENACKKCGLKQGSDCVVCSLCNAGYHTYCITSVSRGFPENGWCCPSCMLKTGIEDPGVISISQATREVSNNVQVLSLMPDQSADKTSETIREPLILARKGGVCKACGKDDESVLLCDACDAAYHMSCLSPVIESIPEENWFCPVCLETQQNTAIAHEIGDVDVHHCAVCDRIGSNSLLISVQDEPAEHLVVSYGNNVCKLCGGDEGEKSTISCSGCEKVYHLSCVMPSPKKFPGGVWFCPSCLCRVCKINVDDDKILLCDNCDEGYHTYCLSPPLLGIPKGHWFCPACAKSKTAAAKTMPSKKVEPISSESEQILTEVSKRKRKSAGPRRSF